MLLTADELIELTGRRRSSAQIAWLRQRGWAFQIRADGRPAVAIDEFRAQMCSAPASSGKRVGPNLAALDRLG